MLGLIVLRCIFDRYVLNWMLLADSKSQDDGWAMGLCCRIYGPAQRLSVPPTGGFSSSKPRNFLPLLKSSYASLRKSGLTFTFFLLLHRFDKHI